MKTLNFAILSFFILLSSSSLAGIITGEFRGYLTDAFDAGDDELYQNEYYNSISHFNGAVSVGDEINGFFTYNTALAAPDSYLNDPYYANHHSTDDAANWLSLSFVIGGETFTISTNPQHVNADTIYRQDTVVISNKYGLEVENNNDSFHVQEDNHHVQSIFDDGIEQELLNKKYGYLNVWDLEKDFISSDSLIQNFELTALADKNIGSAYFVYRDYLFNNSNATYDYYEQFSANMNITSMSIREQLVSVPEPASVAMMFISLTLLYSQKKRRR